MCFCCKILRQAGPYNVFRILFGLDVTLFHEQLQPLDHRHIEALRHHFDFVIDFLARHRNAALATLLQDQSLVDHRFQHVFAIMQPALLGKLLLSRVAMASTDVKDAKPVHGTIDGLAGGFFVLALGSANFSGSIHGNTLTLTNYGTNSAKQGNCTYTYNATVNGTQAMDSISGTITYSPQTNGNPDCSAVECSATQKFSGSRPPK